MPATPRQQQCMDFIEKYQREHGGVSPSMAEISEAVGYGLRGHKVNWLIESMVAKGFLRRIPKRARALEVIHRKPMLAYFVFNDETKELEPWQRPAKQAASGSF